MKEITNTKIRMISLRLCAALVFFIPFILHYRYSLNAFYHFGAPINDAGMFAHLSWRGDWKLSLPAIFGDLTFFHVHFSPIIMALNSLSYLVPIGGMVEYYSVFLATVYASIGLALFYAVNGAIRITNPLLLLIVAIISTLLSFNASIMHGIWHGHIEYAIPLGIFLFLLFYTQNKMQYAIPAFIFTLIIREDAGFHLIAPLGLLSLVKLYETRSLKHIISEVKFIILAMTYSVLATWFTLYIRNYQGGTFQMIYSGTPPYAHLNWNLLSQRITTIAEQHIYLWAGFFATIITTIYTRNKYMMIGFIAYIPWFLLNWTAYNPNTGVIYAYYSYPFIISMMWPIIAARLQHGHEIPRAYLKPIIALQICLVAASVIMVNDSSKKLEFAPIYGARWGSYNIQNSTENRQKVMTFFNGVNTGQGNMGTVMADNGSITMVANTQYQGKNLLRADINPTEPVDSIIAMLIDENAIPPEITKRIEENNLPYKHCMVGTSICVFTNRRLEDLP